ncbi:uroporphyrinogen-III synthase [Ectobacillus funiculus]|uniref:uroporphyrinogen-III synthase n=1 Tax=Ectobacillus funiculus TaxID=137993 RepID=UPI003977FF14
MNHLAPLSHISVLIMRAETQAKEMAAAVRSSGGIPIEIPLLQIEPSAMQLARPLQKYDWIIFTSTNGVRFFLEGIGMGNIPSAVKLAAVGEKTKRELEAYGYQVHFMPEKFVAEVFAREFLSFVQPGARVLFPKGNIARDILPNELRANHILLDEIVVYETRRNEAAKELLMEVLRSEQADVLTFTSPSTVVHFAALLEETNWREWTKRCTIACIGPVTERAALAYFPSVLVPDTYTIDGLLRRLEKHFANGIQ